MFPVKYRPNIIVLVGVVVVAVHADSTAFSQVKDQVTDMGQLALVQVVFRHGDRAPERLVPLNMTLEKQAEEWSQDMGQITPKGLEQIRELGEFLRKRYDNFLSKTYLSDEILVMSTWQERAIRSALSLLHGLYPGVTNCENGTTKFYQPQVVPLRTVPKKHEKLLTTDWPIPYCPKQRIEIEKMKRESVEYQQMDREYLSITKEILDRIGNVTNEPNIPDLLAYLKVLVAQSKSLPFWVTPRILSNLDIHILMELRYLVGTPALQRLSSAFLQNVLANMEEILMDTDTVTKEKRENETKFMAPSHLLELYQQDLASRRAVEPYKKARKFYIFSAHDLTLCTLMFHLGVFNNLVPPYATAVIVETYLKTAADSSQLFVQVFLRNSTEVAPILLYIPNCPHPCQLDVLQKIVEPIIPQDYDKECESLD